MNYSKIASWRIKCSTYSLPTLDILNRNYPSLLNGFNTCFFCHTTVETNLHLWTCPAVISKLIPIFIKHHDILRIIISTNSNSHSALFADAIKYCEVFNWTTNPPNTIDDAPHLHCLLLNFVPTELLSPFKAANIGKQLIKKNLFQFLLDLHHDIYNTIWKERSSLWKEKKQSLNITKASFKNFKRSKHRRDHHQNQRRPNQQNFSPTNHGYNNPFNDSRRAIDNSILWIYLTSSNFLHNLPWLSSLKIDLSSFSSYNVNLDLFYF
ncbi:hypothetical protein RhiirA4_468208 [Rhizophagus irregularis]|uniref:Uncharacterized protein n=1 Tax=Rhizophagus irregularis TaxID=588596 RepID=A0A2I1GXB1_9GLOM|nr:hypothetical protein RhiirA4_468208 [Rhizophagus irregularis]